MFERTGRKNQIRALSLLLCLIMALPCLLQPGCSKAETEITWREEIPELLSAAPYTEGSVIAGFSGISENELAGLFPDDRIDAAPLYEIEEGTELLAEITSSELTTEELLRKLAENPAVLYAEPDYLTEKTETGENTQGNSGSTRLTPYQDLVNLAPWQWGLSDASPVRNGGLNGKDPNSSVHAFPDLSGTGSNMDRTVYCAVIDGFVDYNNADLTGVMVHFTEAEQHALGCWEWGYNASTFGNAGQTAADFVPDPHGTHCAGLLGASWDGKGISGAASKAKIVSIQTSDPNEDGYILMSAVIRGYRFVDTYNSYYASRAPEKVIRIVSMSIGLPFTTRALNAAVYELGKKYGTLSFIAAGNESYNNDTYPETCGTLRQNPYAFVVASTDQTGRMSSYSNYGVNTVTLGSPGSNMLSTMPVSMAYYFPGFFTDPNSQYADLFTETFDNYNPDDPNNKVKISQVREDSENPARIVREGLSWTGRHSLLLEIDQSMTESDDHDEDDPDVRYAEFRMEIHLTQAEAKKIINTEVGVPDYQLGIIFSGTPTYFENAGFRVKVKESTTGEVSTLEFPRCDYATRWSVLATGETKDFESRSLSEIIMDETHENIPDSGITLVCNFTMKMKKDTDAIAFDCVAIGNSCVPYTIYDGTSMATPVAAGVGAVYASRHPEEDGMQLAARIRASVTTGEPTLKGKLTTEGRIDLNNDRAGNWTMPGQLKAAWPLYEKTLPLDTMTGQPFRHTDSMGDTETIGPLVELDGKLWYLPAYTGDMTEKRRDIYVYREVRCFDTETETWDTARATEIPSPLWGVSACAWNGKLWIYGVEATRDADGFFFANDGPSAVPYIYSYDPDSRVWKQHSANNIRSPGAATLFANDDGLMIFDNSTNGIKDDTKDDPDRSLISAYDPQSGVGRLIAEIIEPDEYILDVVIASRGKVSWIAETYSGSGMLFRMENGKVERIKFKMPEYLVEYNPDYNPQKTLRHVTEGAYPDYMTMIAGDEALYFVGLPDEDKTADTWILPYDGTGLKPYEKHVSVMRPVATSAEFCDGKIYAITADWGENNARVFRATRVEGEEPTPVPTATPAPTCTPKPVPKTGDKAEPALYLILVIIGLIGIIGSGWMIMMKQKKEQ